MFLSEIPKVAETGICEIHGHYEFKYTKLFEGKVIVHGSCMKCIEIKNKEEDDRRMKEQEEKDQKRLAGIKQDAGISQRHHDCKFKNFHTDSHEKKNALEQVESYWEAISGGASSCLVMAGNVGTGKTHLASAIANNAVESRRKVQIIKMSELIRDVKDTWRRDSERSETDVIKHFSEIWLLIIDEIGIQFGSDTEKLLISEVIDNRYQSMLPTVLISNLDLNGIKSCIGERSYDRLREDGGKVIAFTWSSERGKKWQSTHPTTSSK